MGQTTKPNSQTKSRSPLPAPVEEKKSTTTPEQKLEFPKKSKLSESVEFKEKKALLVNLIRPSRVPPTSIKSENLLSDPINKIIEESKDI